MCSIDTGSRQDEHQSRCFSGVTGTVVTYDGGHVLVVHRVNLDTVDRCKKRHSSSTSIPRRKSHGGMVLTEMVKVQLALPSRVRVPVQYAQSNTSLLALLLDNDGDDIDVSGFGQVLDPDRVGRSGAEHNASKSADFLRPSACRNLSTH